MKTRNQRHEASPERQRGRTFLSIAALAVTLSLNAHAGQYTLLPSDDGYVGPLGADDTDYMMIQVLTHCQADVKFQLPEIQGTITRALLSVNPYALPLWGNPVDVYGFGTSSGRLGASDYNAGIYLGSWTLPGLNFGEEAYFDVTSLFSGINAPYVAFNLRSGGDDIFSSLKWNYGHPSELILTTVVPEPSTLWVLGGGVFCIVTRKVKKESSKAPKPAMIRRR
jgi:PEP-CTERM motif